MLADGRVVMNWKDMSIRWCLWAREFLLEVLGILRCSLILGDWIWGI